MVRALCTCLRSILQLIRNNLKPLILLASLGTFLWLVVDTTNRQEFTRHGNPEQQSGNDFLLLRRVDPKNRWSESSVQIFLDLLDLDTNVTALVQRHREPCPLTSELVFSAFVDDLLEENLWQYYTLIALRQIGAFQEPEMGGLRIVPFLPRSTKRKLERLFDEVPMETIGDLSFDCYDIGGSIVVNSTTQITRPQRRDQLFILDNGARRYLDLTAADWGMENRMLSLTKADSARKRLAKLHDLSPPAKSDAEFVGIYVRRDDLLPFDYYYRAIALQRNLHGGRLIFVVVCEEPQGKICQKLHAPAEQVFVQGSKLDDPGHDFALMSLCNHTIVSNQMGIFHALNAGGEVVVYEFEEPDARDRYLPWLMANEMDTWYMLR